MSGAISGAPVVQQGPPATYNVPAAALAIPASINAGATYTSPVIQTFGMPHIAASAQLTQTGTLTITTYLDPAGTIPSGSAITQALTANTLAVKDTVLSILVQAITYAITNSSGSAGTPSNTSLVLGGR